MQKLKAGLLSLIINYLAFAQVPPHPRLLELLKSNSIRVEQCYAMNNPVEIKYNYAISEERSLKKSFEWKNGAVTNALIILVNFPDKVNTVSPSFFDNLIYSNSNSSLKSYFKEASYNQFVINTENTCADIGWVTAPKSYNYYVNSKSGIGDYPNNSQKLVEDVIPLLDSRIDFSKYDNNKDGYVDALMIVHAGAAAEYTGSNNDFWSHAWAVNNDIYFDGVRIYKYSVQPEYFAQGVDATIGVFAHELGHSLFGLPDLYDRDYTSWGLGDWSIMASGTWNGSPAGSSPALPDAWSRIKMGFNSAFDITTNQHQHQFAAINSSNSVYRIRDNTKSSKEYFLIENRQKTGFDSYLPSNGILIYHVDEAVTTQNDKEYYPGKDITKRYLVALEQADGLFNLEKKNNQGDHGDPFPGSSNNTNFNAASNPSSCLYNETSTDFTVKNIRFEGNTAYADIIIVNTKLVVVNMNQGWDLISFPAKPDENTVQKIVSNSNSPSYLFNNNYSIASDFIEGKGYWTRGISKIDFTINTQTQKDLVVNLSTGWNLIGSSPNNTPVEKLIQRPLNNITTFFYGFENGYKAADTLRVGKGYWVKAITNGTLTLPASLNKTSIKYSIKENLSTLSVIEFRDALGNKSILYTGDSNYNSELPPLPPSGIFDVRWQSNKLVEPIDKSSGNVIDIISAIYPLKIKSRNKNLLITDCINGKIVNEILSAGKEITVSNSAITQLVIKVVDLPTTVELYQNYPNPFNPTTAIRYKLHAVSRVTLKVYDVLGRVVAVLVDEIKQPGSYNSQFSILNSQFSSGVYFYRLTVDGYSITKKMILTK